MTATRLRLIIIGALIGAMLAGAAAAQCTGDCNGDGTVAINELITGVNIALGSSAVTTCPSFDVNSDGTVAINELIAAVNIALGAACSGTTPTPTVTTSPTTSVTPVPPSEICARPSTACGDGFVDVLSKTETCDDNNTVDDDGCPSNCCVRECTLMQNRPLRVNVNFATNNPDVLLIGLSLWIRYPDGVIDVPGTDDAPPVIAAISSDIFAVGPRDFNYGMNLVLDDPTLLGYNEGTAATITFGVCDEAAAPPPISSITCEVREGTDGAFQVVPADQITCTLTAAP